MKREEIPLLYGSKKQVIECEKAIAYCELDIESNISTIKYHTDHNLECNSIPFHLKINRAKLEYLKAQKALADFELAEAEKKCK